MQRLADRVSAVFVPAVLVIAAATLAGWLASGASPAHAFTAAVAVLIIACPCALGLATPTAILVGTGRGAQLGILIKGPEVLESTRRVDTVVLDKTGTVTAGRMTLTDVVAAPGVARDANCSGWPPRSSPRPSTRSPRAIADAAARPRSAASPVVGLRRRPAWPRRRGRLAGSSPAGPGVPPWRTAAPSRRADWPAGDGR